MHGLSQSWKAEQGRQKVKSALKKDSVISQNIKFQNRLESVKN